MAWKRRIPFLILCLAVAAHARAQAPVIERDEPRTVKDHLGDGGAAYVIKSKLLSEARRVNIAIPASFEKTGPNRRYPVIFALDGEHSFGYTVAAAQHLADQGQIPEAIVVAVENVAGARERVRDLTPPGLSVSGSDTGQRGDQFLDFLENELAPALARQFRAGPPNVLIGHSSGGVLATWTAATRNSAFPFIVAIDTPVSLQNGWLCDRLIERARKSPAGFLRYVTLEAHFGWSDAGWDALQEAAPASWELRRERLPGESHNSMPFLATYLGLRQAFAGYSMLAAPQSPTSAALEHYRRFNDTSGLALVPPRALLAQVIEDLLLEGRADSAQSAFDALISGYGDTPNAALIHAQIEEASKLPPLEVTVDDMLATPMPDAAQVAAYFGEWNGTIQVFDNPPRPARLRIELNDGGGGGTWMSWPERETEKLTPLQYLKVVDDGLHFGFVNGMRPRGMVTFEGVLRGGRLEGEMHMRGIRLDQPGAIPRIRFSLQRAEPAARQP